MKLAFFLLGVFFIAMTFKISAGYDESLINFGKKNESFLNRSDSNLIPYHSK